MRPLSIPIIFAITDWSFPSQRFTSDLGWLDSIGHPGGKTDGTAFNASIYFGGHSLVAGSMWALVDTLRFADGQVRLRPLPAT